MASKDWPPSADWYGGVIVECKQGYSSKLPEMFRDIHKRNPNPKNRTTIAVWGPWAFSWMEDRTGRRVFDQVWNQLITSDDCLASTLLHKYYVEWINRKPPKYLEDYMQQAEEYVDDKNEELDVIFYPLVALHGNGMAGRIIVWRLK